MYTLINYISPRLTGRIYVIKISLCEPLVYIRSGGFRGARTPPSPSTLLGPICFYFHAFFGQIWSNNKLVFWCPLLWGWRTPSQKKKLISPIYYFDQIFQFSLNWISRNYLPVIRDHKFNFLFKRFTCGNLTACLQRLLAEVQLHWRILVGGVGGTRDVCPPVQICSF